MTLVSWKADRPELLRYASSPKAARALERKLRRIQAAHKAGDADRRHSLIRDYLTDPEARRAATRLAASKLPRHRRPPEKQVKEIARKLSAYKGTQEPVRLLLIPKAPNKYRSVLSFGIENKASQYLVASLLHALANPHTRQFLTQGGVHAAIKQAQMALRDGYHHAVEIDISDCFPSFDGDKLASLVPLSKKVIEGVLISRDLNISSILLREDNVAVHEDDIPHPSYAYHGIYESTEPADTDPGESFPKDKYLADARRGIPQGSPASSEISEMLLAPLLHTIPPGVEVMNYADNILLLSKDKDDAASSSLRSALLAHPAGPFRSKAKEFSFGSPIDFLGHRITPMPDGDPRIEPTPENIEEFNHEVNAGLLALKELPVSQAQERAEARKDLKAYVRNWTSAFGLCDGIKEQRACWNAKIDAVYLEGLPVEEAKKSPTIPMTFRFHPDQFEIVWAAIAKAKRESNTKVDTVALEYICAEYLGQGAMAFGDWQSAITYGMKHVDDQAQFIAAVIEKMEELTTHATNCTLAPKEDQAA